MMEEIERWKFEVRQAMLDYASAEKRGDAEAIATTSARGCELVDELAGKVAAERERNAGWFALVMNAAAALEDAANCLRDPDARRAAEGAAKHYRTAANAMWAECVGSNARANLTGTAR